MEVHVRARMLTQETTPAGRRPARRSHVAAGAASAGARADSAHGRSADGFTLIELLVTVVIIGIIAAVAVPTYMNQRAKAREVGALADARAIHQSIETWYVDAPRDQPITMVATLPATTDRPHWTLSATSTVGGVYGTPYQFDEGPLSGKNWVRWARTPESGRLCVLIFTGYESDRLALVTSTGVRFVPAGTMTCEPA
jgi:prepilin-type N-terminal cleavage/methylation domain-containing protein